MTRRPGRPSEEGAISLREYIEARLADKELRDQQRFDAQNLAVKDALLSAEKAVSVAANESLRWREQSNEWRGAMTDRERTFLQRIEADQRFSAVAKQISDLKNEVDQVSSRVDITQGRGVGASDTGKILIAVASVVVAIIAVWLATR